MRCPYCTHELTDTSDRCPGCGADLTPTELRRQRLITLAFAFTSCVAMAIIIYFVLRWHEYQTLGRIMG